MRLILVVVIDELVEHGLEVATVHDQHPVEALTPDSADEALCDGVGARNADRRADDPHSFATEDLVEVGRELGVPVPDQEFDW